MDESSIRLVKKAIRGSKPAYGELIKLYQTYLYKTAFLYLKNETDSLDAVQECVTKGLLGIGKLKEPAYFKTWITRILINCIYQDKRKTPVVSFEEYQEKITEYYLIEEKIDLYDAIDSLRAEYKTVIILFYFQELKIREIAQIMKIPEGSVKAYLYRAKKEIRKILFEEENRHAK